MELLLTNKYSIMNSIPLVFWLIPIASVVALGMAWFFVSGSAFIPCIIKKAVTAD